MTVLRPVSRKAFTLIEIMITVLIIGLILAIAMPSWFRQRNIAQGRACSENLTKISWAKEQYAMEKNLGSGTAVAESDLWDGTSEGLLKKTPRCPGNGAYTLNGVGTYPVCTLGTVGNNAKENLHVAGTNRKTD